MTYNISKAVHNPERLAALRKTGLLAPPSEVAFDRLTSLATRILDVPVALVSLVDENRQFFKSCIGLAEPWASQRETPLILAFCRDAVDSGEPLVIGDARQHPLRRNTPTIPALKGIATVAVPLITSDKYTFGAFCVIDHRPRAWTKEEIRIISELAAAVLTEIERRVLTQEMAHQVEAPRQASVIWPRENDVALERANKALTELTMAYDATIESWSQAVDLHTKEPEGHTHRVTQLTLQIASDLGIKSDALVHIRRGALLHDIGKMGIPDSILLKPGPLTEQEWDIMRLHPVYAHRILSPITYLHPALHIPYCHHEKWDGTGYPRGLKGEEIPLVARIFAVVDVWDVLHSDQVYRRGWPEGKVRDYIREQAGEHFDPHVVDIFLAQELGPHPRSIL